MKRRSFLGVLGLIPALPVLAKVALLDPPTGTPIPKDMRLAWYGKPVAGANEWHSYSITRDVHGVEKYYVDEKLVKVVHGAGGPFEIPKLHKHVTDVTLDFRQETGRVLTWPEPYPEWT